MDIRSISVEEIPHFLQAMSGPFAFDLPDDEEDRAAVYERFGSTFEPTRARCAFDGSRIVGTLGAFSFELTTPGGSVPCAGTTMVTVQTSHRRQGVLTQMMQAHLDEAREGGDAIAALFASDSAIYRRFGFGEATLRVDLEIDRAHVSFGRLASEPAPVRVIDADEAALVLPRIYDAIRPEIPGFYRRSESWWTNRRLRDTPDRRDGAGRYRFVLTEGDDGPTGYAQFRIKEGWDRDHGGHEVRIAELLGTDGPSWSGLWRHVLSHDLASKILASLRSPDDPVRDLLAGPRRAHVTVGDGLWVRVLDVTAALEGRRYATAGTIAIRVHDPIGLVDGTYRLEVDVEGTPTCSRTGDDPDLELDVEDLGAAYLGRSRLATLGHLGRVVGSRDTLRRVDLMFSWDRAPWCPEVF